MRSIDENSITYYVLESKLWEYDFDHLLGSVKSLSNCDMTDLMFGGWCGDISERPRALGLIPRLAAAETMDIEGTEMGPDWRGGEGEGEGKGGGKREGVRGSGAKEGVREGGRGQRWRKGMRRGGGGGR